MRYPPSRSPLRRAKEGCPSGYLSAGISGYGPIGQFEREAAETDGGDLFAPFGERHPSESAARPSAKSPHVARREAPAVVRKDRGTIGLRFSARHPLRGSPLRGPLRGFRWRPANPGCVTRIAATMEHALMAETQQHTPYLPLVGRSDDAFRRRRGGGVLRRRDTHPTRRALRARLPPHQGEGWSSLRRAK